MAQSIPSVWIFHAKNQLGMSDVPAEDIDIDKETAFDTIGKMFAEAVKNIPLVDRERNKIDGI